MTANPYREMHLHGMRYRGSAHHTINGGRMVEPDVLTLHYSAGGGGLEALHAFFRLRSKSASYNAAIDLDGAGAEFVPWEDASWHAGDGWFPAADDLLANGFVPVQDVPKPPKRYTNLRSRSVCFVNRGYVTEGRAIQLRRDGLEVFEGRHRNPASRSRMWQAYTRAQVEALEAGLPYIVERCPTIKIVTTHADMTNAFIKGGGKFKGGSKVDLGPAWEEHWNAIPWHAYGLTVARYDYDAQGWRLYPNLGRRGRPTTDPGRSPGA